MRSWQRELAISFPPASAAPLPSGPGAALPYGRSAARKRQRSFSLCSILTICAVSRSGFAFQYRRQELPAQRDHREIGAPIAQHGLEGREQLHAVHRPGGKAESARKGEIEVQRIGIAGTSAYSVRSAAEKGPMVRARQLFAERAARLWSPSWPSCSRCGARNRCRGVDQAQSGNDAADAARRRARTPPP